MCMMITGCNSWVFASYDPRFSDNLRMHIAIIERNEDDISLLKNRIFEALKIMNNILKKVGG